MSKSTDPIQAFWDDLLSEDPDLIRRAFASLNLETRRAVLQHLHRMVSEQGWHELQVASARAALDALANNDVR